MFAESSTAVLQLPCCPGKQGENPQKTAMKPLTQVGAYSIGGSKSKPPCHYATRLEIDVGAADGAGDLEAGGHGQERRRRHRLRHRRPVEEERRHCGNDHLR